MGSASREARPGLGARAVAAIVLALMGCAHAAPRQAAPRPAVPDRPASSNDAGRPVAPAATPARGREPPRSAPPLDPSEVMTPEELASIPDPVPEAAAAADTARAAPGQGQAPDVAPPADLPARGPGGAQEGAPGARTAGSAVWRVQIYASPDLKLADRLAKEASARLGVPASIEYDAQLYKVRLGDFATEEEAQALRARAVREGYPGAFRVRALTATSSEDK